MITPLELRALLLVLKQLSECTICPDCARLADVALLALTTPLVDLQEKRQA